MSKVVNSLGSSQAPYAGRGGWLTFKLKQGFDILPSHNIGSIKGGIGRQYNNTRPALMADFCTITVDIRTMPGMTKETVEEDLTRFLEGIKEKDPDFRYEIEFLTGASKDWKGDIR